jgi:hypothetical protein
MQMGKDQFREYWHKSLRMLRGAETTEEREKFALHLYADHGHVG